MSKIFFIDYDNHVCPFGVRDLKSRCCYDYDMCKYFVKYNWLGSHPNSIFCKYFPEQLSLF